MSEVYFVFSDESGNYKRNPGRRFLKKNPYYIRSACIIRADEWLRLRKKVLDVRENFPFDKYEEIKWSDTWVKYNQGEIDKKEYNNRIAFIEEILKILSTLSYCNIVYTVTFNLEIACDIEEKYIKKWHIQEIMQRVQMEIQSDSGSLGILFLDPPSSSKELKEFQEIYREIFLNDQFIEEYANLKDAINFEPSHHSVGIQLADYLAGCFKGFLCGYRKSSRIFEEIVYPLLRRDTQGNPVGYGIREVPKDENLRQQIEQKLEGLMTDNLK